MAAARNWGQLAAGTRRRWVSAFGGSREFPAAIRASAAEFAYLRGEHLPAGRTGHERAEVGFAGIITSSGVLDLTATNRREASRLGTYAHDTGALLRGEMDPAAFRRKWNRRVRTIGDVELEANPGRVIAALAEAGPPSEPFYTRRRLGRTR